VFQPISASVAPGAVGSVGHAGHALLAVAPEGSEKPSAGVENVAKEPSDATKAMSFRDHT
jgi:hypothetical protein